MIAAIYAAGVSSEPNSTCVVCGAGSLAPHLEVAGDAGDRGLIPTTDRFGTALADIARCGVCGHMQLDRFPPQVELAAAYESAASDDYVAEETGQRATAARLLERIEPLTEGRRILDLGCWVGFLLSEAERRGWEGTGVEPSGYAAAYARDELGLRVHHSDLFAAGIEGGYDAVVMADVIEHLIDPGAALERIAELLVDGGTLALVLPDAGSRLARIAGRRWWSVLPTHVQYFTRASLARLLGSRGFEPLVVETAPKAFTVDYYLERIGGYSRPISRGLRAVASGARFDQRLWAPDFRDRMLVVSRHRGK